MTAIPTPMSNRARVHIRSGLEILRRSDPFDCEQPRYTKGDGILIQPERALTEQDTDGSLREAFCDLFARAESDTLHGVCLHRKEQCLPGSSFTEAIQKYSSEVQEGGAVLLKAKQFNSEDILSKLLILKRCNEDGELVLEIVRAQLNPSGEYDFSLRQVTGVAGDEVYTTVELRDSEIRTSSLLAQKGRSRTYDVTADRGRAFETSDALAGREFGAASGRLRIGTRAMRSHGLRVLTH